jgi:signal transduction histidine kinase
LILKVLQRHASGIIPGTAFALSYKVCVVGNRARVPQCVRMMNEIPEPMVFSGNRWLTSLSRLTKRWTVFLALLLAAVFGAFDYGTGYDLHLTAFYLIPVCWVSWSVRLRAGLLLAGACAVSFGVAMWMSGHIYEHPIVPFWNALLMLALFSMMACWTAAFKTEIAERIRAEKAKVQAERLLERREKLAVLGTLTAGIAHEIRNPLTSLKARLYTLEKHLQSVPAARRDTEIISAEISRLERIVQDALSFARPSDPKLETIAADTLLGEIQGLMSTSLEGRAVKLVVEPNPGLSIRADSGHLKQVLINLVGNAADAIDGNGTITLSARTARVQLGGRETDAVVLEVSDTGKGIPPEIEKRLFDPFFSTKETGTGLGLPIAARIVERHGGRLEYQTQLGHGTTFSVVLPREIKNTASRANDSANRLSGDQQAQF